MTYRSTRWKQSGIKLIGSVAVAGACATAVAAPAAADPAPANPAAPMDDTSQEAKPSVPMPVRSGAFGYLATRSATLWMHQQRADRLIAGLPVPPAYAQANSAMATALKRELDAAAKTPGACIQIIFDGPSQSSGIFNYGFFAVEKQYCPK